MGSELEDSAGTETKDAAGVGFWNLILPPRDLVLMLCFSTIRQALRIGIRTEKSI